MGTLIRSKDWRHSTLGTPGNWPQSLRTAVGILLNSKFPMFVWWGPELITIYNDAYCPIAGEKHPRLLGQSGKEAWKEIWPDLSPLVEKVFMGVSTWSEDQVLYMNRRSFVEETYFTFSYSPILDDQGNVAGLFCACIETTEKILASRKIQESERNLRHTILQSPVAMCILRGPAYVVEIANERMFEVWGKTASQALGRPIFEGVPEASNQGLEQLLKGVYESGEPFSANERPVELARNSGIETVYLNFLYQPFREGDGTVSGIIAVANDVTEQVLARKQLEASEQELQSRVKERTAELEEQRNLLNNIMVNSSNGISVTEMIRDEQGAIINASTILANDAAVKFIGLPRDVFLGTTATQLDPNILSSAYGLACLKTLATGEPSVIQYHLAITARWLELTVSKMDADHLIHIFTDVTPIKEAQIKLERLVDELKHTNANLEEFAYAASHDLKEPIRKIKFFLNLLKEELQAGLNEKQHLHFDRLQNAANRMGNLVDDLLSYSQVTLGFSDQEPVDLNKKVQLVLEDLELEILQRNAEVHVGALPTITGNKRQMQQLFQNLVANALKYSKEAAVPIIQIASRKVHAKELAPFIEPESADHWFYLVEVKDNGIGFDQSDAERIFNVFTRLHGMSEYRGTGVGLSIVKKVAENHGGFVWAESSLGAGATFFVALPAGT